MDQTAKTLLIGLGVAIIYIASYLIVIEPAQSMTDADGNIKVVRLSETKAVGFIAAEHMGEGQKDVLETFYRPLIIAETQFRPDRWPVLISGPPFDAEYIF